MRDVDTVLMESLQGVDVVELQVGVGDFSRTRTCCTTSLRFQRNVGRLGRGAWWKVNLTLVALRSNYMQIKNIKSSIKQLLNDDIGWQSVYPRFQRFHTQCVSTEVEAVVDWAESFLAQLTSFPEKFNILLKPMNTEN